MTRSKYNATYFIKKLERIPADLWCTGNFIGEGGRHCALGHVMHEGRDAHGMIQLFRKYLNREPSRVNDGDDVRFQQKEPKARVISALYTIKAIRQQRKHV